MVIDIISTGIKFVSGYFLVSAGFGAFGMLVSFLLQYLLMAGGFLVLARRRTLEFKFGGIKYAKEIIRDGLANAPSKFSKILILSLSVVLLASIGIKSSDIGIFYVALMVSVVATGGLGSALAYMAIPASAKSGTDLSPESARIGISLMSPLVAALIVSPKYILSIIGTQYESAHTILVVLAIATFLSAITMNTISKFNNLNDSRRILSIGTAEILTFLVGFYLLAPHYGILGAAISTLIAFLSSSVISIRWSGRTSIRYFAVSGIAILSGVSCGYISSLKLGVDPLLVILVSICSTMIFIFILKNTSPGEMAILMRSMISKK